MAGVGGPCLRTLLPCHAQYHSTAAAAAAAAGGNAALWGFRSKREAARAGCGRRHGCARGACGCGGCGGCGSGEGAFCRHWLASAAPCAIAAATFGTFEGGKRGSVVGAGASGETP
eukprot:1161230-Pelagomonas_calceolata.AAC.7